MAFDTRNFEPVEEALENAIRDRILPCAVIMTADHDEIAYSKSFGPVTESSVFWAQSMAKAITATACMQLVEQGRLSLEQDMGDLLPPLRQIPVLDGFEADGSARLRPANGPVRLVHLLTHTSGVTDDVWSAMRVRYETAPGNEVEFGPNNLPTNTVLDFDPGARWQYGYGFGWVGKAIEAVSGESLSDYFRRNIFEPLGMVDTGYRISDAQRNRLAPAFTRRPDGKGDPLVIPDSRRNDFHHGNGHIFTTPQDYMTFLRMLLNGGIWQGATILRRETVKLMRTNHIGHLNVKRMVAAHPDRTNDVDMFPDMHHKWGISFDINPEKSSNGRSEGSFGWAGAANLYYWVDPTQGIASVFMTQVQPFFDPQTVKLFGLFERNVYAALG